MCLKRVVTLTLSSTSAEVVLIIASPFLIDQTIIASLDNSRGLPCNQEVGTKAITGLQEATEWHISKIDDWIFVGIPYTNSSILSSEIQDVPAYCVRYPFKTKVVLIWSKSSSLVLNIFSLLVIKVKYS